MRPDDGELTATDKLAILTRAARLLSSSTAFASTLEQTISACLPSLGDFGFFDLRLDEDEVVRTARAHHDDRVDGILRPTRWIRQERTDLNLCALSSGQPALHTAIDDEWYRKIAANDGHLEVLRSLAFRSMLTVPMRFGDDLIGALTLFFGASGRQHDAGHLQFAIELAAMVVPIVVNARLLERQRRAEEALRVSEERLRLAIDAGRLGIWDWNVATGEVVWSDRVYQLHGVRPGEFGGRIEDFAGLVHPDDQAQVAAAIASAIQSGDSYHSEFRIVRDDGVRWLAIRANLIRDPSGAAQRMVGATFDITDRIELLAAERAGRDRLEVLARAGELLTSSLDPDTTLRAIASAMVPSISDWCRIDLVDSAGELQMVLCHHQDPALARRGTTAAAADRIPASVSGSIAWVASTSTPQASVIDPVALAALAGEEVTRFVTDARLCSALSVPLVARGRTVGVLTAMHAAERPRQLSAADIPLFSELAGRAALALDNARLYVEAERARHDAETANRAKDDFLAILGHELRNPLAPITAALRLMETRAPDHARREREVIDRQVSHLSRLVDDLLDVARIAHGKVEITRQRVDLRRIVGEAIQTTRPLLDQHGHRVEVELGDAAAWVDGDPVRLEQVVGNLVGNAARFSPPGTRVAITLTERDGMHALAIRDWGAGIAPALLPQLFQSFVQGAQALDRRTGGLGLGLAIVANLVALHEGRVTAVSDGPGRGSTFTVFLPRAAAEPVAEIAPVAGPGPRPGTRVLVVDDNLDAAEMLAEVLVALGLDVAVDGDPEAALRRLEASQPDVAILDIGLPGIDGYELARRIRAMSDRPPIRLIALTGYGLPADRARAHDAGFDRHLVKPVDIDALAQLIAELVGS